MRTLLLATALFALPATSHAQNSIFDIPEEEQSTYADVGVAGLFRHSYVGADETEFFALPYAKAEYKGRFFVNPGLGAGAYAIRNENVRLGASVNFLSGRDDSETPFNTEDDVFEVDSSIAATGSARFYTPVGALDVVANVPFTGDLDGFEINALFTTEFYALNRKLRVTPGIRGTYHSASYLDSLYGVTAEQLTAVASTGSDATIENFGSEVSTVGAHAIAYYDINDKFQLIGTVNYSLLINDVRNTTLAPRNGGITAALAIARTF